MRRPSRPPGAARPGACGAGASGEGAGCSATSTRSLSSVDAPSSAALTALTLTAGSIAAADGGAPACIAVATGGYAPDDAAHPDHAVAARPIHTQTRTFLRIASKLLSGGRQPLQRPRRGDAYTRAPW